MELTHVIPTNDLRDHDESQDCWCHPSQNAEEPSIWIHNAMDRREEYENGRKPS